jgi:hypothetical protein
MEASFLHGSGGFCEVLNIFKGFKVKEEKAVKGAYSVKRKRSEALDYSLRGVSSGFIRKRAK